MKQTILSTFLFFFGTTQIGHAQNTVDTGKQAKVNRYYQLALQYKNGTGVPIDYKKAYQYFAQAGALGDAQSMYAIGYMQFKGLGCAQDYTSAANLFAKGAFQGRDNSMYFYGLCWRNGYGMNKNEDSAKYWLSKADSLGYKQARLELKMIAGENENDLAKALVQQINNAAIPDKTPLNTFTKIYHSSPSSNMVEGQYSGWLVQYDWSGQNVVNANKLLFSVKNDKNKLTGIWIEGTDTAAISAVLSTSSLKFENTKYKRKDHYSPDQAVAYDFTDASLTMVQQGDTLFLAGNVSMFSPERREPSKPLFVALSRKVEQANLTLTQLTASPNPFTDILNIDFQLGQQANIEVQFLTVNGTIIYRNDAGILQAGHYRLPLQPGFIASGIYLLKLVYDGQSTVIKIVKG